MLDQIIYTRCSKHRSLENNGQEEIQDGFNVYSMSEEIFSHYTKDELNFLKKRSSLIAPRAALAALATAIPPPMQERPVTRAAAM